MTSSLAVSGPAYRKTCRPLARPRALKGAPNSTRFLVNWDSIEAVYSRDSGNTCRREQRDLYRFFYLPPQHTHHEVYADQ